MNRKLVFCLFSALTLMLFAGCRHPFSVAEALQQPEHSAIYTQCNLWYDANNKISSLHFQSGTMIPFGTEVEIVNAYGTKIKFKTASGGVYTLMFHPEWLMIPMPDYARQVFTLKNRDQLCEGMSEDQIRAAASGQITKGMSRREVLLARGFPPASRTPSISNSTWVYWKDRYTTIRVVFQNDKVIEILSLK